LVDLVTAGIVVILTGIIVVLLAVFLGGRSKDGRRGEETRAEVKGGGVIMIGPIPIIFGSDPKWTSIAIVLAIILVVLSLLLTFYGGR
jgi:uncharacterized protein (TIGR00304 family)